MIGLLLLAGAALGWWAWKSRDAQAMRLGDVAAVIGLLIGLRLLGRGEALPAALALGGGGWWLWFRRGRPKRTGMDREEASGLLGVPLDASPDAVRAAHRRLVARVHPDAGGSVELAARVNAARDTLLARR
jgi:DnaJ-domain-containing protein 1